MEVIAGLFGLAMVGVFFFSFIASIVLLVKNSKLRKDFENLETLVKILEKQIDKLKTHLQRLTETPPARDAAEISQPDAKPTEKPTTQPTMQPIVQPIVQPIASPAEETLKHLDMDREKVLRTRAEQEARLTTAAKPISVPPPSYHLTDGLEPGRKQPATVQKMDPQPSKVHAPEPTEAKTPAVAAAATPQAQPAAQPVTVPTAPSSPTAAKRETQSAAPVRPKPEQPKTPRSQARVKEKSEFWQKLERQFMDNWTGILGSVILVMGAGFLSIYAALKMPAFFRFLMLCGFSTVLFAGYFALRTKNKWLKLGTWLRSSGCAVFLFACLGSGGIPGLKWIDAMLPALGLLVLGVAVNLVVGTASGSQFFASFHSIISLAALAIGPQNQVTLGVAAAVTLLQVILSYRDRWEYHLLTTITAFFTYHLYWVFASDLFKGGTMPPELRFAGIGAVALIGAATAFVHYRELYGNRTFDVLPFFVHLFNWFYMGIGLYLYSTGSKWNTVILAVASLAAFILSRRAKGLGIRWLFVTDTLIAQSLALIAILTLQRWEFTAIPIMAVLMLQVMVFLVMMIMEEEQLLQRAGVFLYHLSAALLATAGFVTAVRRKLTAFPEDIYVLTGALLIYTGFHFFLVKKKGESFDSLRAYGLGSISESFSLSGVALGPLAFTVYLLAFNFWWGIYGAAAYVIALMILRQRRQYVGLNASIFFMVPMMTLWSWAHIVENLKKDGMGILIYGAPLLIIGFIGIRTAFYQKKQRHVKHIWIYFFSIQLALLTANVLNPVSALVPGMVWLLLAPLYLEVGQFLERKYGVQMKEKGDTHRYLYHWGYIFMALFIGRHLLVHLQSEMMIGGLPVRFLQELLALGIFIYWGMSREPEGGQSLLSRRVLQPLMWETAVILGTMIVAQQVADQWYPVAWVLGAVLLLTIGLAAPARLSRFRFYAVVLYWMAAFHIAFISSMDQVPAVTFTQQAWFGGLVALVLLVGFVVYFYRKSNLESVELPTPVKFLRRWVQSVAKHPHPWIYYPYFLAVGLFLFWTFDKGVLTLLWVVEIFVIFALSIFLRERHFRYVALIGLGGCLLRLIFYDLAHRDTLTRALVFLGVGALMIFMNVLYNKYKDRFQNE